MSRRASTVLVVLLACLAPAHVLAGTVIGPLVPVGSHCVLVNDDSCSGVGPYSAIAGYGWGFEGLFVGDLELDLDAAGYHHAYVCTGIVLAGALEVSPDRLPYGLVFPNCEHQGQDPPQDLPVTLSCTSRGVGVAVCSILD